MDEELLREEQDIGTEAYSFWMPQTSMTQEVHGVCEYGKNFWSCDVPSITTDDEGTDVLYISIYGNEEFYNEIAYGESPAFYYTLINVEGKWRFGIVLDEKWPVLFATSDKDWGNIRDFIKGKCELVRVDAYFDPKVAPSCNDCDEYHVPTYLNPVGSVHIPLMDEIDEHFGDPIPQEYIDEEEEARQQLLD